MKIKVSDYIAEFLSEQGISDVFTVVGGGAMHLNDSFGHHPNLNCIYNHHEQACAIAAEAYARHSNKLPLVCVTSGPGGTNALTGVVGGWLDSIPMFIISGQVKFETTIKSTDLPLRQLGDQEFNITDTVKTMTKYAVMVTEKNEIRYHLERAVYIATHGRPGPCWIDIPLNIQGAMIETDDLIKYNPDEDKHILPPFPQKTDLELLVQKIKTASKPLILAGSAIRLAGCHNEFIELIDKIGIPVVTAWNAHDCLWDSHPLYCGRPGTVGTRGGNFIIQECDLLISFGCRMNIRQISYEWQNFAKDAYIAYIDIDEAELKKPTLHVDLPIHADIKDVISELLQMDFEDRTEVQDRWLSWCRDINLKYPAAKKEFYDTKKPLNPYVFMYELSKCLHENDTIVTGNGSACVCSFQAMELKRGQRLFTNSGCASMGYGLPAALGVSVLLKGNHIICLDGDGSIQMNIQELQTIKHSNLNVKIFWLNNNGYHSIRQTQTNTFNSSFYGISENNGISFPSAEKIAYAYGLKYCKIDSIAVIHSVLEEILSDNQPVICEGVLDESQFFEPKLSSRVLEDGTIVSPSLEDMYPFLSTEETAENKFI